MKFITGFQGREFKFNDLFNFSYKKKYIKINTKGLTIYNVVTWMVIYVVYT